MNLDTARTDSSLFSRFSPTAEDPIFKLLGQFRADQNPQKIDLGIGVYRDENGGSPIFQAVKQSEIIKLDTELEKTYIGPRGDGAYIDVIQKLIFKPQFLAANSCRLASLQTPGGSCALRMAFDLVARGHQDATVWLSNPTWQVHRPIIQASGLKTASYPYYGKATHSLAFAEMLATLASAEPGDIVLIQASCQNPTGCDMNPQQWAELTELLKKKHIVPLIDMAYHGLGNGLVEDAAGLNIMAAELPELIVSYTCSKNFGLYRDRAGLLTVLSESQKQADIIQNILVDIATGLYFTPPSHPGAVVKEILTDTALSALWKQELSDVRKRINLVRRELSYSLISLGIDAGYLADQSGMFSLLDLTYEQIVTMREKYSIYIVGSGRINIAGINSNNINYFIDSYSKVVGEYRSKKAVTF
ncbi:aromatic amino acid transaminase [Dasania sp. GY-MA-18]|uniref:Aromatic amino acid transaminase n=1 Tax=Dasania phycosphaerae TaxID=2950436 RepID=A0A9J6RKW7_9GAMM|nr:MULTISPECIES: aromatic amino acid transaminase [Dasania]MCR8922612.1 aromatic amino acid transaminase [Dasania sp. GY-MA-18]MCZ0865042.1 aromatic amino acid transaminase [Dasania phycosphaerae]MCZ0868768.1 aromatic amino acid transaminase [Dasania phycosphaerae]